MFKVIDKDLPAAVNFQMDGLHPYADEDVVSSWARLPRRADCARWRSPGTGIQRYATWFSGRDKVGTFACAGTVVGAALFCVTPPPAVLAIEK